MSRYESIFANIPVSVQENPLVRSELFGSTALLDKLIISLKSRSNSNTLSKKYIERFRSSDDALRNLLSSWESSFVGDYHVFHAWLNVQRKKLRIVAINTQVDDYIKGAELRIFEAQRLERELIKDSSAIQTELDSILTIFTPTLEEAFADIDDTVKNSSVSDHRPSESAGVNDEIFRLAREKYNYLLKKLIPKMRQLKKECDDLSQKLTVYSSTHPHVTSSEFRDRWEKCITTLSSISSKLTARSDSIVSSPTYNNLMILLASEKSSKRPRINAKSNDSDYDEWF